MMDDDTNEQKMKSFGCELTQQFPDNIRGYMDLHDTLRRFDNKMNGLEAMAFAQEGVRVNPHFPPQVIEILENMFGDTIETYASRNTIQELEERLNQNPFPEVEGCGPDFPLEDYKGLVKMAQMGKRGVDTQPFGSLPLTVAMQEDMIAYRVQLDEFTSIELGHRVDGGIDIWLNGATENILYRIHTDGTVEVDKESGWDETDALELFETIKPFLIQIHTKTPKYAFPSDAELEIAYKRSYGPPGQKGPAKDIKGKLVNYATRRQMTVEEQELDFQKRGVEYETVTVNGTEFVMPKDLMDD
jgi:hypothetical protein